MIYKDSGNQDRSSLPSYSVYMNIWTTNARRIYRLFSRNAADIEVNEAFRQKRELISPPFANVLYLWGLAVATVISGEYAGWNFGLANGWGSFLVSTLIANVMYWCVTLCLSEMSSALPFSGGQATFMTAAVGSLSGGITGYIHLFEFLLATAQLVMASSSYITMTFNTDPSLEILWWFILLGVFMGLNMDTKVMYISTLVINVIATVALVAYGIIVAPYAGNPIDNWNLSTDGMFPNGFVGIINGLPFAVWWFLGIELLPVAAEETKEPGKTVPKAFIWSMATLTFAAWWTFFFCTSTPPGIVSLSSVGYPLNTSADTSLVGGVAFYCFMYFGLLASLQGLLYGSVRYMYALSRSGYLPQSLSITHKKKKVPMYSVLTCGIIAIIFLAIIRIAGASSVIAAFLINSSIIYALLGYIADFIAFIYFRLRLSSIPRHFVNPFGIPSAILGLVICITILICCLITQTIFQIVFVVIIVQIILFTPYYIFYVTERLLLSPEKVFIKKQLGAGIEHMIKLLHDPVLYPEFQGLLEDGFCPENGLFFQEFEKIKREFQGTMNVNVINEEEEFVDNSVVNDIKEKAAVMMLYEKYIKPGSPCELNVPSRIRDQVTSDILKEEKPKLVMIEPIMKEVISMMYTNTYPKYILKRGKEILAKDKKASFSKRDSSAMSQRKSNAGKNVSIEIKVTSVHE